MFTDLKLLNDFIEKSGYRKSYIAQFMGVSKASLFNKLTGKTDLTVTEVNRLRILLRLSESDIMTIFFNKNVSMSTIFEAV